MWLVPHPSRRSDDGEPDELDTDEHLAEYEEDEDDTQDDYEMDASAAFGGSSTSAAVGGLARQIEDISSKLRDTIFNLAAARLQIEMIMSFCGELAAGVETTAGEGALELRQRMIEDLQRAFAETIERAVGTLMQLADDLGSIAALLDKAGHTGQAGINIEHCGLDGTTVLSFVDALLATQLSGAEIVVGTMAAGLLRAANGLAAAFPLVVLMVFLGGVDPGLVLLSGAGLPEADQCRGPHRAAEAPQIELARYPASSSRRRAV